MLLLKRNKAWMPPAAKGKHCMSRVESSPNTAHEPQLDHAQTQAVEQRQITGGNGPGFIWPSSVSAIHTRGNRRHGLLARIKMPLPPGKPCLKPLPEVTESNLLRSQCTRIQTHIPQSFAILVPISSCRINRQSSVLEPPKPQQCVGLEQTTVAAEYGKWRRTIKVGSQLELILCILDHLFRNGQSTSRPIRTLKFIAIPVKTHYLLIRQRINDTLIIHHWYRQAGQIAEISPCHRATRCLTCSRNIEIFY
jgi:hypothetical protein